MCTLNILWGSSEKGRVVKRGEEAMYHKLININSWSEHIEQESLITAVDKSG